jgi:uncharacterized membrane protein
MNWAIAFLIFLTGCNYNRVKSKETGSGARGLESGAPLDYKAVQNLMRARCVSCHSNVGGNQGGTNLETYPAVRSKLNRVLYRSTEALDMPPKRPLNEREQSLLKEWADSGAPETIIGIGEKPGDNIESGPTNWTKIKDRLFAAKCSVCHRGETAEAGLDLTDLSQVRNKAPAIFDRVIVKQDMPIAPYPAVTPKERRTLLKWFDAGMPE